MWSWHYDVTNTHLINLIWVNSCRCTCLSNLVVISLIEMDTSILISILRKVPWKKLKLPLWPAKLRVFKISNTNLQFRSPGYSWHKTEKKEKKYKNTGNIKALCVSRKRKKHWQKQNLLEYQKHRNSSKNWYFNLTLPKPWRKYLTNLFHNPH